MNFVLDYVVDFGIREKGKDLIMKWYYNFMKRWFELYVVKLLGLLEFRVKVVFLECILKYFKELKVIIDKYGFIDKF